MTAPTPRAEAIEAAAVARAVASNAAYDDYEAAETAAAASHRAELARIDREYPTEASS